MHVCIWQNLLLMLYSYSFPLVAMAKKASRYNHPYYAVHNHHLTSMFMYVKTRKKNLEWFSHDSSITTLVLGPLVSLQSTPILVGYLKREAWKENPKVMSYSIYSTRKTCFQQRKCTGKELKVSRILEGAFRKVQFNLLMSRRFV